MPAFRRGNDVNQAYGTSRGRADGRLNCALIDSHSALSSRRGSYRAIFLAAILGTSPSRITEPSGSISSALK